MFFKKKAEAIRSEEYESVLKKISDIRHDTEAVKAQLAALQTNYDNLRGQFNRKLAVIRRQEQEDDEQQDLNSLVPFTGMK